MQMSYLYASDSPFKTFAKSLKIQKQYEKNVWEKTNDAYSLSSTDHNKPYFDLYGLFFIFTTISTISARAEKGIDLPQVVFLCWSVYKNRATKSDKRATKSRRDDLSRLHGFEFNLHIVGGKLLL